MSWSAVHTLQMSDLLNVLTTLPLSTYRTYNTDEIKKQISAGKHGHFQTVSQFYINRITKRNVTGGEQFHITPRLNYFT